MPRPIQCEIGVHTADGPSTTQQLDRFALGGVSIPSLNSGRHRDAEPILYLLKSGNVWVVSWADSHFSHFW